MSLRRRSAERTAPDLGPVPSALLAVGLAAVSAIGAAALTAIGLAITFELMPMRRGPYEQFRLIGASGRFAAEAVGIVVLVLSYRGFRGLRARPDRVTILRLMKGIALFGLIAARLMALLGPWLSG